MTDNTTRKKEILRKVEHLSKQIYHLDILVEKLQGNIDEIAVLHGGIRSMNRKMILENIIVADHPGRAGIRKTGPD